LVFWLMCFMHSSLEARTEIFFHLRYWLGGRCLPFRSWLVTAWASGQIRRYSMTSPNISFNRTRRRRALSVGLGGRWLAIVGGGAGPVN